ncbi:20740_t:CDS:2, partial [Dentiscutata erythropus]
MNVNGKYDLMVVLKNLVVNSNHQIVQELSPYYNIPYDHNLEIKICNSLRPEFPNQTPEFILQIISCCWDAEPPKIEELND